MIFSFFLSLHYISHNGCLSPSRKGDGESMGVGGGTRRDTKPSKTPRRSPEQDKWYRKHEEWVCVN